MDPSLKAAMPYFGPMIDNLTQTLGYQIGVNMHGAGYDWRLGPIGHSQQQAPGGFFVKLRELVESTVQNNSARAHLVSHSLGGPTTLAFLHAQGTEWCSKYVESFIPLSGPWIGAAGMIKTEIGGNTLGEPIPHDYLRPVQQQSESGVFLLPYGEGWADATVVSTPSVNYTVDQLGKMIQDLNLPQTSALYQALVQKNLMAAQLPPPPTRTHVMYSSGVKTELGYVYNKDFTSNTDVAPTKTINGDGDGTVNLVSLQWAEKTWKPLGVNATYFSVPGVIHSDTVHDPRILARLIAIITNPGSLDDSNQD